MRAIDIGTSRVIQAPPTMGLREAAQTMRKHQVGCLVVVHDEPHGPVPEGILTDRDLVTRALAAGCDVDAIAIGHVMSSPPVVSREDATLDELIAIMRGTGVRRLPVVNLRGALVGIVSADDVLVALTGLSGELIHALVVEPLHNRTDL